MPTDDPFWKLRVPDPIPPDELCSCTDAPPLLLRTAFGPCPVACSRCNLELRPETLAPSAELVDNLASWRDFYGAFYALWLDSEEFETWARSQLADPTGPVNVRGLTLRSHLESNSNT